MESTIFNFAAGVPGLALKTKEKELINFTLFNKDNVSLKSFKVSPGYPIIKSLENLINEFFLSVFL